MAEFTDLNAAQAGTQVPAWEDLRERALHSPAIHLAVKRAECGQISREAALVALAQHLDQVVQRQQAELRGFRERSASPPCSSWWLEPPWRANG